MLFAYTDIIGISDYDYKVDLFLTSKEKLNLWGLGYQYEDFLFQLFKLRNELMLKYLLMEEKLLKVVSKHIYAVMTQKVRQTKPETAKFAFTTTH